MSKKCFHILAKLKIAGALSQNGISDLNVLFALLVVLQNCTIIAISCYPVNALESATLYSIEKVFNLPGVWHFTSALDSRTEKKQFSLSC